MSFAYIYSPQYESVAKILILPRTTEGSYISTGDEENRVFEVSQQIINTEIELINSNEVIEDTILSFTDKNEKLTFRKEENGFLDLILNNIKKLFNKILILSKIKEEVSPLEAQISILKNSLYVEPVAQSNIIIVTLRTENKKTSQKILNRLIDTYIEHHNEVNVSDAGVQFYRDQAEKFRNKLEIAENRLNDFRKESNIIDLHMQNNSNIGQIELANQSIRDLDFSIVEKQEKLSLLRKGLNTKLILSNEIKNIPTIVEIEKALVPLYIERSNVLKNYTTSSREYLNVNNQINVLKNEIRNEVKKAISAEEIELDVLKEKRNDQNIKLSNMINYANILNSKEKRLNELKREVELSKNNYILYTSKMEDAIILTDQKIRNLANVSIADRAQIPNKIAFPNRLIFLIVSFIIGTFAAIATPFILEYLDERIKSQVDIEEILSIPVIAIIPYEKPEVKI
jgi:uncharacterized protein involved in exopolysaccharide biosynthesis